MVDCSVAGSATGFAGAAGGTAVSGALGHRYCYAPAKALDNTKKTQSQNKQQTQHKPFLSLLFSDRSALPYIMALVVVKQKLNGQELQR